MIDFRSIMSRPDEVAWEARLEEDAPLAREGETDANWRSSLIAPT